MPLPGLSIGQQHRQANITLAHTFWPPLSAVMHVLPFRYAALAHPLLAAVALWACLGRHCALVFPAAPPAVCARDTARRVTLRAVLLPLAIIYCAELLARRNFLGENPGLVRAAAREPAGGGSEAASAAAVAAAAAPTAAGGGLRQRRWRGLFEPSG